MVYGVFGPRVDRKSRFGLAYRLVEAMANHLKGQIRRGIQRVLQVNSQASSPPETENVGR